MPENGVRIYICAEAKKFFIRVYYSSDRLPYKIIKHTQTISRQHPTNCSSVFDHFVGLALKGLVYLIYLTRQILVLQRSYQ